MNFQMQQKSVSIGIKKIEVIKRGRLTILASPVIIDSYS